MFTVFHQDHQGIITFLFLATDKASDFVDQEEIKRDLNRILIYECRCDSVEDQELKLRDLHLVYTGFHGVLEHL